MFIAGLNLCLHADLQRPKAFDIRDLLRWQFFVEAASLKREFRPLAPRLRGGAYRLRSAIVRMPLIDLSPKLENEALHEERASARVPWRGLTTVKLSAIRRGSTKENGAVFHLPFAA
jgi:hypothetical protein